MYTRVEVATDVEVKVNRKTLPFFQETSKKRSKSAGMKLPGSWDARRSRGQLTDYASRIRRIQHRVCTYSAIIQQNHARFMRWDQVGCIVSEPIDLKLDAVVFLRFFYFAAQMTDEQLGWDPTVKPVSD